MVNRVFCYSKDTAKKNGNRLPVLEIVLLTIIFIAVIIASAILFETMTILVISMIIFMILLIYYSILLGLRMRSRMVGYALDNNGRIFKAMAMNNGQGLYFGGVAVGGLIDQMIQNDSSLGESLGGAVGAFAQFYAMNRSAKYMSHPEIVAQMVEQAPNITGAEVYEILNVYSIVEKKKSIKVNCDYTVIRTNKIKYRKNMTIEKSYKMYEDLIEALNAHRS